MYRRQFVGGVESENLTEEGQLRLVDADVRLKEAEPVRLAFEFDIRHRHTAGAQGIGNKAGLIWRHYLVVQPLKDEQRHVDFAGAVNR